MPWDSVDKYRDEDVNERRRKSRRRFKIGGRRGIDNLLLKRERVHVHRAPSIIGLLRAHALATNAKLTWRCEECGEEVDG